MKRKKKSLKTETLEEQRQTNQIQRFSNIKNIVLLSLAFISQLHVMFRGSGINIVWLLNDKKKTLNFTIFLMCMIIKDMVLIYCLWKPKGIDKRVPLFLLILSVLDILHLAFYSFYGLEEIKIAITFVIFLIIKKFYRC